MQASYGAGDEGEPMHVPEDIFKGEDGQNLTPERKAAVALGNLFTMAATRVILDQFTGTRHRSPVYYKMVGKGNGLPSRCGTTRYDIYRHSATQTQTSRGARPIRIALSFSLFFFPLFHTTLVTFSSKTMTMNAGLVQVAVNPNSVNNSNAYWFRPTVRVCNS